MSGPFSDHHPFSNAAICAMITRCASESAAKYVPKELVKASRADQFIGDGTPGNVGPDNLPADKTSGSSSWRYRLAWSHFGRANTGNYMSRDIVMLAANGSRGGAIQPVVDGKLNGVYMNIDKAIQAGVTFIADTEEHLTRTGKYNTGEVALAEYLQAHNYFRADTLIPGGWKPLKYFTNTGTYLIYPSQKRLELLDTEEIKQCRGLTIYPPIDPSAKSRTINVSNQQTIDVLNRIFGGQIPFDQEDGGGEALRDI
jgi:hypothetical protein